MNGYAGYNQISIALQDIHKTTFAIPWGIFVYLHRLIVQIHDRLCGWF
jgi:hypothetical protein